MSVQDVYKRQVGEQRGESGNQTTVGEADVGSEHIQNQPDVQATDDVGCIF